MRTAIRFLILLSAFSPLLVSAATAQFVFTTDPQTLTPGELSQSITVQSQEANGTATTTSETIDLGFLGTSPTGEFLNASGNAVSTVMNKGTTNRTFYYRDQSSGQHTLTVKATGRTSGQSWSITQGISVTGGAGPPPAGTATPSASSSDSAPPVVTSTRGGAVVVPLEQHIGVEMKTPLRAVAGADIVFEASAVGLKKEPLPNARFIWSFGDGATTEGKKVLHAYHLPASYVVLVEASSGEWSATDRADITVATPQVLLWRIVAGADGFIEVKNNGTDDLDLSRWFLRSGSAFFSFPNGTILRKGNTVPFSSVVTKLIVMNDDTALLYPNGTEAVRYVAPPTQELASPPVTPPAEKPTTPPVPSSNEEGRPKAGVVAEDTGTSTELVASVGEAEGGGNTLIWAGLALAISVLGAVGYLLSMRHTAISPDASANYEIVE